MKRWTLLIAVALVVGCGHTRPASEADEAEEAAPPPDGICAVAEAGAGADGVVMVPYDGRYTGEPLAEAELVAVDAASCVPLELEGEPTTRDDGRGHALLSVTLRRENAARLEELTRKHLGGRVAIVLDGEVVTQHKVRSVVAGGQLQITRCTDDACEVLRAKLE